ncbi:MAG: plasmid maintenance system killer [Candidatus Methylomirabilota bacterium]|nr:MAG: plasmid maintenance system killer [candidate division NC10 bacterium]
MIKSFANEQTEGVYLREFDKRLPAEVQQAALRKLRMINNAKSIQDLRSPPGNRLEKLRGDRAGQYSIRVNDQWRVCFEWRDDDAYEVEIADYH